MRPANDVLIVGGGPTGLLLAGDLAAAGVSCAVVERRGQESNLTRAFAVHARTLEMLDARGIADDLLATGQSLSELRAFGRVALDLSRLPSRYPFVLITPQYQTERVLEERARASGVEIVGATEFVGLRQDAEGVEVDLRPRNGGVATRRASYVVGADGVHSTVRAALGLPFPGRSIIRSVMLADVRLRDGPADLLSVNANGEVFAFIVPFGDGLYRVIAWDQGRQLPDSAPVELEEIRDVTRRALGTDYGMHDPRWMSRFHSDERQVPRYRVGRVFLAGDAAHVHSPAGGLGMNTGLQDAANLSWKLAAAVHGWAPPGLLDSYDTERRAVGRAVLRESGAILRLALLRSRMARAARNAIGGAVTHLPPVAGRLTGAISGLAIGYPALAGAHKVAGKRAPDLRLSGANHAPGRLYEALRDGRFVIVHPRGVRVTAEAWSGRVNVVTAADAIDATILVRPDGYIAWASEEKDLIRRETALRNALTEWCGAPA